MQDRAVAAKAGAAAAVRARGGGSGGLAASCSGRAGRWMDADAGPVAEQGAVSTVGGGGAFAEVCTAGAAAADAERSQGWAVHGDLVHLARMFPAWACWRACRRSGHARVVDLAAAVPAFVAVGSGQPPGRAGVGRRGGLAAAVAGVCGLSLSKEQQVSDWEQRPLTKKQVCACALVCAYLGACTSARRGG